MKKRLQLFLTTCLSILGFSTIAQVTYNYTGAPQTYTVPPGVSSISIEAWGAEGGDGNNPTTSPAGQGAYAYGEFNVTPGETFTVIVGEAGEDGVNSLDGGGGGGGSFVILDAGYVPYLIASGGGGGSYQSGTPGQGGQATTAAGGGGYAAATVGQGGNSDNGGGGGTGAGGGGWNSTGLSNNWATGGIMQGGAGGVSNHVNGDGGYGGGGAAYHGGGGGGGYTGGGGGIYTAGAGGGGSYNIGTNQVMTANMNAGNGQVIIAPLCTMLTTSVSATTLCEGEQLTLSASGAGTITWDNGVSNGVAFTPPVGTTTYTATSSDPSECDFSVAITVNAAPNATISALSQNCFYDVAYELTVGSPAGGVYSGNGVIAGLVFEPGLAGIGTHTISYTITDPSSGCEGVATTDIVVDECLDIDEVSELEFELYPNPSNDGRLTIKTNKGIQSVEIIDLLGRTIDVPVNTVTGAINGTSLVSGKYIVKVQTNDDTVLQGTIIIQK